MPLTRLTIKNFKSIKECDITFSGLNVLIGENGTGKTNILDAVNYFYRNLTDSNISTDISMKIIIIVMRFVFPLRMIFLNL